MNTRILEGFEISDEAVYAFGDLTVVVTFKNGAITDLLVGSTQGDFSDDALLDVLINGQPLDDVQRWLDYIPSDVQRSSERSTKSALEVLVPHQIQTFSGTDGSGTAWIIGLNDETFAFAKRDNSDEVHYVPFNALNIVDEVAITSWNIDSNTFVVRAPSCEMVTWLRLKIAETAVSCA